MTTVACVNLGNRPSPQVRAGLSRLVDEGADVFCLREAGDRGPMLTDVLREHNWHGYFGGHIPGAPSVPILWNPRTVDVPRNSPGTREVTGREYVGDPGAGSEYVKAKVWNRVRIAGGPVVINGHLVASAFRPIKNVRERRAIYKQQIDALVDMVERRKRQGRSVLAVADFNAESNNHALDPLRRLGMRQLVHEPTHGHRTIDLAWALGIEGARARVVPFPSDHDAVLVTF